MHYNIGKNNPMFGRNQKGINNPMFGKHHSEESKRKIAENKERSFKISQKLKGRIFTEEWKKKISDSKIKKGISKDIRKKLSILCSQRFKGKKRSEKTKQKICGKNNPMYGKKCQHSFHGFYNGIFMRSSWEIIYARWLDKNNYHWIYEPKRFYFEDKPFTYLPDFWVEELKSYVEIKGFMNYLAKEKLELFAKDNPLIVIRDIKPFKTIKTKRC